MANQVIVTNTGNVQVALTPTPNVQVQISRAAIGTVSNVPTANFANYAGNVTGANQPNITNIGTLGNLSVTGTGTFGNLVITGNLQVGNLVANSANYANFANVSNIANSVALANVSGAGNIATVNLDGNASNVLYGNGVFASASTSIANANYANFAGTAFNVSGSNVSGIVGNSNQASYASNIYINPDPANSTAQQIIFGGANITGYIQARTDPSFNYNSNANTLNVGNAITVGNSVTTRQFISNISTGSAPLIVTSTTLVSNLYAARSNISDLANSVALANVSGAGNIASINLDGNVANLLTGNGTFVAIPTVSSNANYANFAGTAFNVSGSNVTGAVANATFATTAGTANSATVAASANSVAGANVSGTVANATFAANAGNATIANSANSVAVANVVGIGNIATVNLDGNASNILYGNGAFSAVPVVSNVANANYANFSGTVITNAQPNITSVGTLTSLAVTGNVSANAYQLTTSPGTLTPVTGQMVWDAAQQTVSLGMNNGVIQQVGLENYILIKASATITDGQVVMFTGANGDNVTGAPANTASAGFRPEYIIGVATQNIANNDTGYVTVFGTVNGLNTNAYNVGDILWVDNTTPGALTATRPSDPNYQIEVAAVTKKAGGDGHIQVRVTAFNNIDSLTDVTITTPANGQALVYSGNVWVNGNPNQANFAATANSVALANVVGIGNIANINLDGSSSNVLFGNGVFAPESTSIANSNYANFAGNLINGTSNISIPSANGTIAFSVNNVANLMTLENGGVVNAFPTSSIVNMLRINTFNNSLSDAHRIAWARARGSNTSPTSVQGSDRLGILSFFGHNGTSYQTNSISFIRATVDASYTANGANIPIGLQLIVNDTNGGTNNQAKTHQFWANGNVSFANVIFADGGGLSNIVGANVTGEVAFAAVANSVAVANVSGIGNIATINLDGNVSNVLTGNGTFVAIPNASANANYANFAGNLINGTSNISIPTANGTIAFSVNNVANLVLLESGGVVNAFPTSSAINMLRINTFGNPLSDAHRVAWARARGSNTSPTSVNPADNLGVLSFFGHNGTSYQTNSVSFIRARVDSSYTANGANIPIGMQILVNDTNGGINNQTKTHNFWANGNVSFSNFVEASSYSATGNIAGGNLSTGGTLTVSGNTSLGTLATSTSVDIKGNNSTGVVTLNGTQFNVTQTDANGAAGYSPFFFRTFQSNTDPIPASKFFRSRGNIGSSTAVATGDQVALNQYAVYADSGNTYKRVFEDIITVTGNDGAGNVSANLDIVSFNTGSNINLQANTYANSVSITSGGFMKLAGYTAAALTAITGSVGQIATVTNSTPGGMMAYWDTTNSRWSYVHDNSAV